MGQLLYEYNELDAATRSLEKGLALAKQWNNAEMLVYGYTALAQVKQAQQDREGCWAMMHEVIASAWVRFSHEAMRKIITHQH